MRPSLVDVASGSGCRFHFGFSIGILLSVGMSFNWVSQSDSSSENPCLPLSSSRITPSSPIDSAKPSKITPLHRQSQLAGHISRGFGVHQQCNDESVQTQDLGENEDQDHSDKETGLLGRASYTSVTHDANGKSSRQTCQTDRQPSTQLNEAGEKGDFLGEIVGNQD